MISRYFLLVALFLAAGVLAAGCAENAGPQTQSPATHVLTPSVTVVPVSTPYAFPREITTTPDLITTVADAAAYARENGREKTIAVFNNPNGTFASGNLHIFALDYNGTLLADVTEPGSVGTNIRNLTDSFGTPIAVNLAETARFGRGFVSYTSPNPHRNFTIEPQITAVEGVDGTYYVACGMPASEGEIYPSVLLNTSGSQPGADDLVAYVKSAVAYAKSDGRETALGVFNDPKGPFIQGQLAVMALDFEGTILAAPPSSPELTKYHINLLNYHDPDGVATIRGMRDIAKDGGGFFYSVASVTVNGKEVYVPKINYVEPVNEDWWIFSGIIMPEYATLGPKDLATLPARNHTREQLYGLVNRAVAFAKTNGKEMSLAEINNPDGQFVQGDLFVWAESADGTVLADPFWKSGIGGNYLNTTDRYGMKTTQAGIEAMSSGTGFSHALFVNTAVNGTADVPKLIYMKAVDDSWWIGSGIYGVEVT